MKKTLIAVGLGIALAMTGVIPAFATAGTDHKVLICHANEGVKGWSPNGNSVDKHSIMNPLGAGHDSHTNDIIPAFDSGEHGNVTWDAYPGKNLDTLFDGVLGSDILANGCSIPEVEPVVHPIAPSIDHLDPCGPDNLIVNVPESTVEVVYTTESIENGVKVTATATEGHILTLDGEKTSASFSWTFEDSDEPCPVETTPPTPTSPPVLAETGPSEDWQVLLFGGSLLIVLGLGFWIANNDRWKLG